MKLEELIDSNAHITLTMIGGDIGLAKDLQDRLAILGILDPPSDGRFGPASKWALSQVLKRLGVPSPQILDAGVAREIVAAAKDGTMFPLNGKNDLAGRIARSMSRSRQWLCRHPDCVNIVYIEGMDPNGTANVDAPNEFNDLRLILRVNRSGTPVIEGIWDATTEPGKYYTTIKKLDPKGAARIAFGQYKAWCVGTHGKSSSSPHEALVQTGSIDVHRDFNEDYQRDLDKIYSGLFGINQHWGYDLPKSDVGKASAGCLVGRTKAGHREFMSWCKSDARFVANGGYQFITSVMAAGEVT